jgi:hypothetical protein
MTSLSPAAQAVMDAFWKDLDFREDFTPRNIAAALRALAVRINGADAIRQDILDIAIELEASPMALTVVTWKPND